MNKNGRVKFWVTALICCCAAGVALPRISGAQSSDKKETLRQARRSYYQLKDEGLLEFQCSMAPNWDALVAEQRKTNPAGADEAVRKLKQLQFGVSMGPDGSVKVTHNDVPAQSDAEAKAHSQIFAGMDQMITGFYQTWSPFMLGPPFPEVDSEYQLEDLGAQYRLSYKEGTADVVTSMGKDFAISELKVTTAEFTSSIRPQFTRTAKGFLINAYQADYVSQSAAEETHLRVRMSYQELNGLQLIQKLNLEGTYGGSPYQMEVAFTGCQAKRR